MVGPQDGRLLVGWPRTEIVERAEVKPVRQQEQRRRRGDDEWRVLDESLQEDVVHYAG